MPLLGIVAARLSIEDRQRGVIEELIDKDEMFAMLPFVEAKDETYSYVRELTNAGGGWLDAYEDIEESASEVVSVNTKVKRFAGQVLIDNFMQEVQSNLNDQTAIQLALKAKGMGKQFRSEVVNGDLAVNAKGFDGLRKLVIPAQTLAAGVNGAPVAYAALDELLDAVKKGADALMMRQGTWRAIRALNRAAGGNTAETVMVNNFGMPIKAYDGMPVIINDALPSNEVMGTNTNTTSIYGVRLNEVDGLHGLWAGASAGFKVEKWGTHPTKDATLWRMRWYAGLALKATHSVARLRGITNI